MSTPPRPLLYAILDQLTRHAPFDQMEREDLEWLAERLELGYYGKEEVVLGPEQDPVERFYIIKQGVVQGEQDVARAQGDEACWELVEGECFPLGALLSKRAVSSTYRAKEDTFCYELAVEDFRRLLQKSAPFQDFCTRRIASLLEQSKQIIQARYSQNSSEQQSMDTPLSAIVRRKPISTLPATPIREVLETMQQKRIGSMVVVDEQQRPLGIFTLHDVLDRVALAGIDLATPIREVMSPDPLSLPPHALAYEAALVMAKEGFRHVLVTENEQLVGLASEKDLFTLQRVGLRQLSSTIREAADLATLQQAVKDIHQLAHNMLAQGIAAEQLTQIVSTLNDLLTSRIIEQELAALSPEERQVIEHHFCWLALGSEGRFEQTLLTDQDNGIIFDVPEGGSAEAQRQIFLPFASRINDALAACGFPKCKGEVMASNPKWCLSLEEWKETFGDWIYHGDPKALLYATIFFDFRPLYGEMKLGEDLRAWLAKAVQSNTRFLHQMAVNALRNRPPLGLVRDFAVGDDHAVDLKLNGVMPFVDAARIYSLATGGVQTNTLQRLREIAEPLHLKPQDREAWGDAFLFIQLLRLRLQHEQIQAGQPMSNRVDPDQFNNLDRRILKEAFRQARKLQTKLALDYQV
jgi:CBS domain-containing protein